MVVHSVTGSKEKACTSQKDAVCVRVRVVCVEFLKICISRMCKCLWPVQVRHFKCPSLLCSVCILWAWLNFV